MPVLGNRLRMLGVAAVVMVVVCIARVMLR